MTSEIVNIHSNTSKIIVKYFWSKTNKNDTIIAYVRNNSTGFTIYGASIFNKSKKYDYKSSKSYYRFIATQRLKHYPVFTVTSTNVHQSIVENEILNKIKSHRFLSCKTKHPFINEIPQRYSLIRNTLNGISNNSFSNNELENEVQLIIKVLKTQTKFINIKNPFIKKKIVRKVIDIPENVSYFWIKNKNRVSVCVYSIKNNNEIEYAASICRLDNKKYLSIYDKDIHLHTAITRYYRYPVKIKMIANNKKDLHTNLRKCIIDYGVDNKECNSYNYNIPITNFRSIISSFIDLLRYHVQNIY